MPGRLFDLMTTDLPYGFCRALIERMQLIYGEAWHSVMNDPRFEEPEARYLHGHTRRALTEYALRELGNRFGMRVQMRRAEGVGGFEHVMLSVGRFCFTGCHLATAGSFPKDSRHREQYSSINQDAAQGQLFPVFSMPAEADIYGIICHSEAAGDKGRLGDLSIGFPHPGCDDWIEEPTAIVDLADVQERLHEKRQREGGATPKWKKRRKKGQKED